MMSRAASILTELSGEPCSLIFCRGLRALFGIEVAVPRTHRQAVLFPYCLRSDDLDRELELTGHLLNYGELLIIFFPEHGNVGFYHPEELFHHGAYAVEMPGPIRAAQGSDEPGISTQARAVKIIIHFLHWWPEEDVGAGGAAQGLVFLGSTGVGCKVLFRTELRGIDKDGHDQRPVLSGEAAPVAD